MRYVFDRCPECGHQFDVADFTHNDCFIQNSFEDVFVVICPKCHETLICRQHKIMKFDFELYTDTVLNKDKKDV